MTYNYSNYSMFGIKNKSERCLHAGWITIFIIFSLLGDTTILIASIKFKAFRIHKIIVAFIQHIAACDLLTSAGHLLPCVISMITNSPPADRVQIYMRFCLNYFVNTVTLLLTCTMVLSKLLLVKYPFKTSTWNLRLAHKACAGIWIASLYVPALHLLVDKDDVIFDYRIYVCTHGYSSRIWKILLPISGVFTIIAPNFILVFSTVMLLREAQKVAGKGAQSLKWQGIITVVLTAMVYSISLLPFAVYCIAEPWVPKDPVTPGPFHMKFFQVACGIINLNILANFFIYSLTVRSFRGFLGTELPQIVLGLFCKGNNSRFYFTVHYWMIFLVTLLYLIMVHSH